MLLQVPDFLTFIHVLTRTKEHEGEGSQKCIVRCEDLENQSRLSWLDHPESGTLEHLQAKTLDRRLVLPIPMLQFDSARVSVSVVDDLNAICSSAGAIVLRSAIVVGPIGCFLAGRKDVLMLVLPAQLYSVGTNLPAHNRQVDYRPGTVDPKQNVEGVPARVCEEDLALREGLVHCCVVQLAVPISLHKMDTSLLI